MLKEFRDFINRGNVLDLAVAVIIGGAFGAITNSLVNEVIMPVIGLILGGVDFSNLGIIMRDADKYRSVAEAVAAGAPVIQYGSFINKLINFFLIAVVLFFIVKSFNEMKKKFDKPAPPPAPAEPSAEVKLLTEIRDALKQR